MSIPQIGWVGLGYSFIAMTTIADDVAVATLVVGLMVALSTIAIRLGSFVDRRVHHIIDRRKAEGDLPTEHERERMQEAINDLEAKVKR